MYILKNAWRNIMRTKGRNVLIGIIIAVIACSCCIGLSIRQAADDAKNDTMEDLRVEAQISVDRSAMMNKNQSEDGKFDMSQFKGFDSVSISVDEMLTYAELESVEDFYYTINTSLSSEAIEPIQTNNRSEAPSEDEAEESNALIQDDQSQGGMQSMPGGQMGGEQMGGGKGGPMFGSNGDFTITGYSSESAMTDFIEGTSYIVDDGKSVIFEEGTTEYQCIITDELATYNSISVGDEIVFYNPNNEEETYTLKVVGLYTNTQSSTDMGMFRQSDPANSIYMSYEALNAMVEASKASASTSTNQFGMEISNAINSDVAGTYVFADVDSYNTFCEEVYEAGLSEEFQVTSSDVLAYEQSLLPLETLSTTAGYFLIVILAIGALVLIVLNMFSIRERKYEVGVLTAIGMKKHKVATQFLTEILIVTLFAVVVGGVVGSVSSVPVANALLENQMSSEEDRNADIEESFGRGENMPGGQIPEGNPPSMPEGNMQGGGERGNRFENIPGMNETVEYVSEIQATVNITVLTQLLGICILLALISGAVSVITIMRYEPLKILSNRD